MSAKKPTLGPVHASRRLDLWKGLDEAADEFIGSMRDYTAAQTPQARARVEMATRQYMNHLAPVIGETAAFQFHVCWQVYTDLIDRRMQVLASVSGRTTIDAADAELMKRVQAEAEGALSQFEATAAATQARIDEAARADGVEESTRRSWIPPMF